MFMVCIMDFIVSLSWYAVWQAYWQTSGASMYVDHLFIVFLIMMGHRKKHFQ